MFDVIIVGGGPAGLAGALLLGRCRRTVLLIDDGHPRNQASRAMHGFPTREGLSPAEYRSLAREELRAYPTVTLRSGRVIRAARGARDFGLTTAEGDTFLARKVLIATGLVDEIPDVPGILDLYGKSVFHCLYCDGWEVREQPLAAYGRGDARGGEFALTMSLWSSDVVLFTDGPSELSESCRARLAARGIPIEEARLSRLEGREGVLERVVLEDGRPIPRRALFFNTGSRQASNLARDLGCPTDERGGFQVGRMEDTLVPGVFVAGDASRDVLQVVVAAAEGVKAAVAINKELLREDVLG